jgi:hypothetical protein
MIHQQEEKGNEILRFSKKFLLRGLVHQNRCNWIRLMLIKVEIHSLPNDLSRNL